jgi:hypothetical protein
MAVTPSDKDYIEAARAQYTDDDIEIDDDPEVSRALDESGAWVAAWVWVYNEEAKP